jgi:hypothetical protein
VSQIASVDHGGSCRPSALVGQNELIAPVPVDAADYIDLIKPPAAAKERSA